METVTYELSYNEGFTGRITTADARVRAIPGGIVVLPPIVAVVLAIATRNVLVALFCGIWTAAFFIHSCATSCMLLAPPVLRGTHACVVEIACTEALHAFQACVAACRRLR